VTRLPCDLGIVFGISFGEFSVLLLVAMVILGPKELPRYLRKAGHGRDIEDDRGLVASALAALAIVTVYLIGLAIQAR
jgi:hypothetical protein